MNKDYITQVFEQIGKNFSQKISKKFSRTVNESLDERSKLDQFHLNWQVLTQSENVPGTLRNRIIRSQEPNEDRFQIDPHPEVMKMAKKMPRLFFLEPSSVRHSHFLSFIFACFCNSWSSRILFYDFFPNVCYSGSSRRLLGDFFYLPLNLIIHQSKLYFGSFKTLTSGLTKVNSRLMVQKWFVYAFLKNF